MIFYRPGLAVTLEESPSLVFQLELSVSMLMSSLLKARTDKVPSIIFDPGEGEGLFHRAISHSGTMLMPIDVRLSMIPFSIFLTDIWVINIGIWVAKAE